MDTKEQKLVIRTFGDGMNPYMFDGKIFVPDCEKEQKICTDFNQMFAGRALQLEDIAYAFNVGKAFSIEI